MLAADVRQRPPPADPQHRLARSAFVDPDVGDLGTHTAVPTVQHQQGRRGVAPPHHGQGATTEVHRQFRHRGVSRPVRQVFRAVPAVDRPGAVLAAHQVDPGGGEHPVRRVPDGLAHDHVRDPPDDVRVGLEGGQPSGVRYPPRQAWGREVVIVWIVSLGHASQCRPDHPRTGTVPANCGQPPGQRRPVQEGDAARTRAGPDATRTRDPTQPAPRSRDPAQQRRVASPT